MPREALIDLKALFDRATELAAINRESALSFTAVQIEIGITMARIAASDLEAADKSNATKAVKNARKAFTQASNRTAKLSAQGEDVGRLRKPLADLQRAVETLEIAVAA